MVAFYITIMEAGVGKLSAVKFAYVCFIKALAKNDDFWYTIKRGLNVKGIWGIRDNIDNYKDRYFFYPSDRPGEFWVASK